MKIPFKLLMLDSSQNVWFEPDENNSKATNARGYLLREAEAEALVELVRRVIKREDFTAFAKKVNKEILSKP